MPAFLTIFDRKLVYTQTRITTFIEAKFKKPDNQTNIDKYRVAANNTEYHIISKLLWTAVRLYGYTDDRMDIQTAVRTDRLNLIIDKLCKK